MKETGKYILNVFDNYSSISKWICFDYDAETCSDWFEVLPTSVNLMYKNANIPTIEQINDNYNRYNRNLLSLTPVTSFTDIHQSYPELFV